MSLKEGQWIGGERYELVGPLGEGGQAQVWRAKQRGIGGFSREVALKFVNAEESKVPQVRQMLLQEAQLVAQLKHPNIVEIYDVGEDGDWIYIAMELIQGIDLDKLLRESLRLYGRPLPWPLVTQIVIEVCKGLHLAHNITDDNGEPLRLVHRDLKPENILMSAEGYLKVIDFGIAKVANASRKTKTGNVKGTPAFMSPEQLNSKPIDSRADLFSLGAITYELCCGRAAFEGNDLFTLLFKVVSENPQPPSSVRNDIPSELSDIVMKLLKKKVESRYQSAQDLRRSLVQLQRKYHAFVEHEDLIQLYNSIANEDEEQARELFARFDIDIPKPDAGLSIQASSRLTPVTMAYDGPLSTPVMIEPTDEKTPTVLPTGDAFLLDKTSNTPMVSEWDDQTELSIPVSPVSFPADTNPLTSLSDSLPTDPIGSPLQQQEASTPKPLAPTPPLLRTSQLETKGSSRWFFVLAFALLLSGIMGWLWSQGIFSGDATKQTTQHTRPNPPSRLPRQLPPNAPQRVVARRVNPRVDYIPPNLRESGSPPSRRLRRIVRRRTSPKKPQYRRNKAVKYIAPRRRRRIKRRVKRRRPRRVRRAVVTRVRPVEPQTQKKGTIVFVIRPICQLTFQGVELGRSDGLTIPQTPGRYRVLCFNKKFLLRRYISFRVRAGKTTVVNKTFRMGKLFVFSKPWSSIHLPPFGQIGHTQEVLRLPVGRHRLVLYKKKNRNYKKTIILKVRARGLTKAPNIKWD